MRAAHRRFDRVSSSPADVETAPSSDPRLGLDVSLAIESEALRFSARRSEAYADHSAMMRCSSANSAADLQSASLPRMVADDQNESGTVMRRRERAIPAKAA